MTVTTIDDYREKHKDAQLVGHIAWYGAQQALVPLSRIKTDLEAVGLGAHTPKPTAVSDQWRKATSAAQQKGVKIGDVTVNVLVRKLVDNKEQIIRSVVLEEVHGAAEFLDYGEQAHLVFDKDTEQHSVKYLTDASRDPSSPAGVVLESIRQAFQARLAHGGCVDQDGIRALLTNVLTKGFKGVSVKETGGVMFIPPHYQDGLRKLEGLAKAWPGALLHSLPLIEDDPENPRKQKEMVASGVTAGVLLEVDQLLAEIREHQDDMSTRRQASIVRRHKEIKARIFEYRDLLEDSLEDAVARINFLALSMPKVLDAVTHDAA